LTTGIAKPSGVGVKCAYFGRRHFIDAARRQNPFPFISRFLTAAGRGTGFTEAKDAASCTAAGGKAG